MLPLGNYLLTALLTYPKMDATVCVIMHTTVCDQLYMKSLRLTDGLL